jgi:hypothetical protein
MEGMRKVWVALAAIAGLVLCLVLIMVFKHFTEATASNCFLAIAGVGGAYFTANVVTKKVAKPTSKTKGKA